MQVGNSVSKMYYPFRQLGKARLLIFNTVHAFHFERKSLGYDKDWYCMVGFFSNLNL